MVQNPGYSSLLILLLFLVGCVLPQDPKPQREQYGPPVIIGNEVIVHIPKGLTLQERAMLLSATGVQLEAFEADWGHATRPVHVWYTRGNGTNIPCGSLEGSFWGCHYGRDGPIHIYLDDYYSAISLYHELVHHNITVNDHDHSDPNWDTFWKPRQKELRAKLRHRHARILNKIERSK